jgi:predicted Zn-dependent protease
MNGETQFNAIHILKNVIGQIQNSKQNCIGVISFTDVDLYTKDLSNFCFGYGIPAYGGV